jgi:alpha-L-fucosidase
MYFRKMIKRIFFLLVVLNSFFGIKAQNDSIPEKLTWFADAKLGIFIHWGIYAVEGTSESWSFHNRTTTYPYYMSQLKGFTAKNYQPTQWAQVIKESGAKYCVVTTQHHDGVALWDTKQLTPTTPYSLSKDEPISPQKPLWNVKKPLSSLHQTPAKRDLITPLVEALKAENIKFGAYYSLLDWSHNDYNGFFKDQSRYKIVEDTIRWNRFLTFMHHQITEINTTFKPDLYWFDGDWEHTEAEWNAPKIQQLITTTNPNAIINGRLKSFGDYDTPEQNMPIVRPKSKVWELCLTSNDNWGYRPTDKNMKTCNEVLQIFTECIGSGGNLLLDIGPKEDGTIPEEQVNLLKAIGRWTNKHQEAIYGSRAGLPYGHFHGPSTLSKDSTIVYLFLTSISKDTVTTDKYITEAELNELKKEAIILTETPKIRLQLKGLMNEIETIEVIGSPEKIPYKIVGKIDWSYVPGTVYIDIPSSTLDPEISVVKIKLKSPLKLYRGVGGFH